MTISTGLWRSLTERGGRLGRLSPWECRRLLSSTDIGRLGYASADGPRIVPMNYTVAGDRLIFRTAPETEAGRCANGHPVAFEVDQFDEFLRAGWSVPAPARPARSPRMSFGCSTVPTPDPWPEGWKSIFLQLPLTKIAGRRVHQA